jgi:hypothetical protein
MILTLVGMQKEVLLLMLVQQILPTFSWYLCVWAFLIGVEKILWAVDLSWAEGLI